MKKSRNDVPLLKKTAKTAEEARRLYNNARIFSPESIIYWDHYVKLANVEAQAKAAACKTVEEARVLLDNAPLGSHAREIYEVRMKELHL